MIFLFDGESDQNEASSDDTSEPWSFDQCGDRESKMVDALFDQQSAIVTYINSNDLSGITFDSRNHYALIDFISIGNMYVGVERFVQVFKSDEGEVLFVYKE